MQVNFVSGRNWKSKYSRWHGFALTIWLSIHLNGQCILLHYPYSVEVRCSFQELKPCQREILHAMKACKFLYSLHILDSRWFESAALHRILFTTCGFVLMPCFLTQRSTHASALVWHSQGFSCDFLPSYHLVDNTRGHIAKIKNVFNILSL